MQNDFEQVNANMARTAPADADALLDNNLIDNPFMGDVDLTGHNKWGGNRGGAPSASVRRVCPRIFPILLPHFRLYEVASLHMCVLPYTYVKCWKCWPT